MKIAFLTQSISPRAGGLCDAVRRFAQELPAPGEGAVRVVAPQEESEDGGALSWSGVEVKRLPVRGPRTYRFMPGISSLFENADLLHTHGLWTHLSVAGTQWVRRYRRPYVISPHGMLDPWALRNSALKKRIAMALYEKRHLQAASCLHAVSRAEAEALRALGLTNPICIIPNGVDLPNLELRIAKGELRSGEGGRNLKNIAGGRKVLLFLSRLHPKKGLPNLLRAWAQIRSSQSAVRNASDWVLVIAGWDQGGHLEELKGICGELGIANCELRNASADWTDGASVIFTGPLFGPDRDAALAQADAFVLPSFSEGLPLAVLEAWAHSLPAIITPGCNLPEGIAAGAAIGCDPDPESLANALRELCRMSDAERQQMGRRGRTLVEERFTWHRVAAEMRQVYEWLGGDAARPASVIG